MKQKTIHTTKKRRIRHRTFIHHGFLNGAVTAAVRDGGGRAELGSGARSAKALGLVYFSAFTLKADAVTQSGPG